MIYIVKHPLKRPAEKQLDLLYTTLDLTGMEYRHADINTLPADSTVLTDCFIMETPHGDPSHSIATELIDHAASRNIKLIFYYPSESYATLSASFCPTAEVLQTKGVKGYLIKCGDWDIPGFEKNYNFPEFFAWIINNDFNRTRLGYTHSLIDASPKTHKFLFFNGEQRTNRERFFELFKAQGLLEASIWSHRSGKSASGFGPEQDWTDPFIHPDFRFYAYYPSHYYQTELSIVSETTQNEFFPTEKIYKSLMLGHPFVIYSGQHSLRKLHNLGFQTFSNVLDESYDNAEFPQERADRLVETLVKANSINNIVDATQAAGQHNRLQFHQVANSIYLKLANALVDIDSTLEVKENFTVTDATLKKYFLN
jgi:hypothetical protein